MGVINRKREGHSSKRSNVRAMNSQPSSYENSPIDLRRLSRTELLELLLKETEENERLRAELDEAHRQLKAREIALRESGSIAEASLRLNGVFEAAQKAADQYLENVRHRYAAPGSSEAMEAQTRARCEQMLRDARSQAESYLQSARIQAQQIAAANAVTPQATGFSHQGRPAHFKPSREGDGRGEW